MIPLFDNSVYEWGLQVIQSIQTIESSVVTYIMLFFTYLSDPIAYLALLPILIWCIDEKKGLKISMFILFSASLNTSIKDFLQVPRPYELNPSVGLIPEHGFSTPSGHSQNSAAFWPYFISLFGKRSKGKASLVMLFILSIGMPLIIGFTRIYLGVHFPSDVLLGWTIGFLLSIGAILFVPFIEKLLYRLPRTFKILMVGIISFVLNLLGPYDTSMSAAFFGLGIGYIYLSDTGGYEAKKGSRSQKILRACLGLVVLGLMYGGLSQLFPSEGENNYQLFRFLRYLLIGFTGSFILPKIFIILKIAFPKDVRNRE